MCGMSLTNIVKSRGPNTEPCGTPLVIILQLDWILLSTTHCCLPTRKFLNHINNLSLSHRLQDCAKGVNVAQY